MRGLNSTTLLSMPTVPLFDFIEIVSDGSHQHCPLWLFDETSCHFGCEGGRCTSGLTDPASRLFKVSALLAKTSEFGDVFLHCESTSATLSLKALFQASSIDTKYFHLIFIDEVPETFDHLIRSICTMVFASSSAKGFLQSTRSVGSLIKVMKISSTLFGNGKALHGATPFGFSPCSATISRVIKIYNVHTRTTSCYLRASRLCRRQRISTLYNH